MDSSLDSSQEPPPIPPNYKTIEQIDSLSNVELKKGILVNTIAFIKDFRTPVKSQGTDYKCSFEIIDHSIHFRGHGMSVNVFWANPDDMPVVSEANSVVIIRNAKVQMRAGAVGLIANKFSTQFHIIAASKIRSGSRILPGDWQVFSLKPNPTPPKPPELAYVTWTTSRSSLMGLPTEAEFQEKLAQSGNVKDKFSLLKDVKPDCFYNILGEVSKIKDPGQDIITVCLSDYTANPNFYNYVWRGEMEDAQDRRGDEYGYTKFSEMGDRDWTGPFGRLTIHLNLFDGHAQFVRESVKAGNWVLFTNVKMGYGKMGGFLEGYLRVDQWAYEGKVQVKVMTTSDNPEDIDPRWKEALRRKVEWQKKYSLQLQSIRDEAAGLPKKRKSRQDDSLKGNSKERRKERRAAAEKKAGMNLNENIKCNFPDKPIISIKDMLTPEIIRAEDGSESASPFTLRKYRANVRVVDYFPPRIEDFAVGRRGSEMDILSDYSGGEETDPEEERRLWKMGKGFAKNVWEWRFELLVEDANPDGNKEQIWLSVDDQAAQGLLNFDDEEKATSLRGNPILLAKLKEQLFRLWGDLEEQKSAQLQLERSRDKVNLALPPSSFESIPSSPPRKAGAQPDIDSDVESAQPLNLPVGKSRVPAVAEHDGNAASLKVAEQSRTVNTPRNKAFTCCIKQYGIMVDEDNPEKANAGKGKRWQRKFALFDTFIV